MSELTEITLTHHTGATPAELAALTPHLAEISTEHAAGNRPMAVELPAPHLP